MRHLLLKEICFKSAGNNGTEEKISNQINILDNLKEVDYSPKSSSNVVQNLVPITNAFPSLENEKVDEDKGYKKFLVLKTIKAIEESDPLSLEDLKNLDNEMDFEDIKVGQKLLDTETLLSSAVNNAIESIKVGQEENVESDPLSIENETELTKPTVSENFICNVCGFTFLRKETLGVHFIRMHTRLSIFPCNECDKSFKLQSDLDCHVKYSHRSASSTIYLSKKRSRLKRNSEIQKHSAITSSYGVIKNVSENEENSTITILDEEFLPENNTTSLSYETENEFLSYKSFSKMEKREEKKRKLSSLSTRNQKQRRGKIVCKICNTSFICKNTLRIHLIRKHTQGFKFAWKECNKCFKLQEDLTTHTKLPHQGPPMICDTCGKLCTNKRSLHAHKKSNHQKTEYTCPICKKCMASQKTLNHHIRVYHAKKERVFCDYCGKSFANRINVKTHIVGMHSNVKT